MGEGRDLGVLIIKVPRGASERSRKGRKGYKTRKGMAPATLEMKG